MVVISVHHNITVTHCGLFYLDTVLQQISHEFRGLSKIYQDVIADITKKMGHGMTVFFTRELNTEAEWDEVSATEMLFQTRQL